MADILRVTTPMPGTESTGKIKPLSPNEQQQIQNVPDPSKVTKPNEQGVYSDRQPEKFSPNLQSNFDRFLQMIKGTPDLTESYGKLFFSGLGNIVNSGMGEGIAKELAAYMDMLKMSEPELMNFIKSGQVTANKFSGIFFDMLRYIVKNNKLGGDMKSAELKSAIVDFLRKYDSYTGGNHILNNMVANLKNISQRMPQTVSTQLNELIGKLTINHENGEIAQNVSVLKNEIIPLISNYISRSRNFGPIRDIINVLVLNLAKYEAGSKENVVQSFKNLTSFKDIINQLEGIPLPQLERFLLSYKPPENQTANIVDKLIQIITQGMKGEAGFESKAIFQNVVNSVLINESVYMPLLHMMIPAEVNGNQFFSEIWVDPNDGNSSGGGGIENAVRMLIKFDIKDLGYFEMVLFAQDNKVDMELFYPERLEPLRAEIGQGLTNIMEKNGLSFQSLLLDKCVAPKTVSEVFPKIYEGRNVVNVTI